VDDLVVTDLPATHAGAAIELWRATGLIRPWNDPEADLRRARRGPSSTVLAALRGSGDLLGTAMVGHDGHRGWVYYLAVLPERQGTGLGRSLVRACETWLLQRDVPKIQLMVRDDNDGAIAFYDALDYQVQPVVVLGRRLDG
jgi:ribosomal protein S18 acetylase RimI-like enzyme